MSNYTNAFAQNYIIGLQATAFDNSEHSDCEVHCGDKKFKVAKFVLCLHSEVFKAAFYHNTIERQNNIIKIEDLDPMLVENMLRYMYTGLVDNLDSIASELYVVADRYAVHTLKEVCHLSLFENLRIENIIHCLELLYTFDNLKRFKPKTLQFVANNLIKINALPEWKEFCKDHGDILREILEIMASQADIGMEMPQFSNQLQMDPQRTRTNQLNFQPMSPYTFYQQSRVAETLDTDVQIINPPSNNLPFFNSTSYFQHNNPSSIQSSYQIPPVSNNWVSNGMDMPLQVGKKRRSNN